MFGLPLWLTIFLILYAIMIIGVWVLSFSNVLFDEEEDDKTECGSAECGKEAGGK